MYRICRNINTVLNSLNIWPDKIAGLRCENFCSCYEINVLGIGNQLNM